MKTTICIVGGGNSTHSIIPLLTKQENRVNLFTRKPEKWQKKVKMEYTLPNGTIERTLEGELNLISSNATDVIPQSDVILLSIPVFQYRNLLHQIAACIDKDKKVYIGTIYGQGGFNWMVEEIINKFKLENVVYFASGLIPWITRTKEYGSIGINYGCKEKNVVAVHPKEEFAVLKDKILDDLCYSFFGTGEYLQSDNFLSLTLSVDNQIIHQTRLYGMFLTSKGEWDSYDEVPFFYRDYDDISAKLLQDLDKEYTLIRQKIIKDNPRCNFQYMLDYLDLEHFSYGSTSVNIKTSFTESRTLGQIPTPVVEQNGKWVFDSGHRFFYDDIYYGIVIAKWFAQKLNIKTPTIDTIINWAEKLLNDTILDENGCLIDKIAQKGFLDGTPYVYGYKNINDVIS